MVKVRGGRGRLFGEVVRLGGVGCLWWGSGGGRGESEGGDMGLMWLNGTKVVVRLVGRGGRI